MIARESASFSHSFLANGALLWLLRPVLNQWEVNVDVAQLGAEHRELLDLMVEIQHHAIPVLQHVELSQREKAQVDTPARSHKHQHIEDVEGLLRNHE
jgi:hypothetical protein